MRHARTVTHDTEISAQVSRRSIDVIQQTNLAVHFGELGSLEIRVPAAVADRWELIDKEIVERRELGRDPNGSRRYRLSFERPVLDKRTLQFRYRLPLVPSLDAKKSREIVLPGITVKEGSAGMTKVGLLLAAEIALEASDPSWVRVAEDVILQASDKGPVLSFIPEAPDGAFHPFSFKVVARETIPMPPVLVPRLLIKTTLAEDGSRHRVGCWVESHGTDLALSIPEGARWLARGLTAGSSSRSITIRLSSNTGCDSRAIWDRGRPWSSSSIRPADRAATGVWRLLVFWRGEWSSNRSGKSALTGITRSSACRAAGSTRTSGTGMVMFRSKGPLGAAPA